MIAQTDIDGRLRLFRYGLVVVVIVTFLVSLIVPYAMVPGASLTSNIGQALITTVVVGVVMGVLYFVYRSFLTRKPSA